MLRTGGRGPRRSRRACIVLMPARHEVSPTQVDADPVADWIECHRGRLLVTSAGLLVVVIALHAWIDRSGALPGDRVALRFYRTQRVTSLNHDFPSLLGTIGLPTVATVTVAVATWLVGRRLGVASAALVVATAAVVIVNDTMKDAWGPTPIMLEYLGERQAGNFPSGHVAYATAVFGYLAWLALRQGQRDIAVVLLAVVVLMGPSRILTHAHFPSDVVGGYVIGAAWLILVIALSEPWRRARPSRATSPTLRAS